MIRESSLYELLLVAIRHSAQLPLHIDHVSERQAVLKVMSPGTKKIRDINAPIITAIGKSEPSHTSLKLRQSICNSNSTSCGSWLPSFRIQTELSH